VPLNTLMSMSGFVPGTDNCASSSLENCQSVYVGQTPAGKSVTFALNRAYQSGVFAKTLFLNFVAMSFALEWFV
jgi:hypothetical protein